MATLVIYNFCLFEYNIADAIPRPTFCTEIVIYVIIITSMPTFTHCYLHCSLAEHHSIFKGGWLEFLSQTNYFLQPASVAR